MGSYFLTDDDVALLKAMRKMLHGVSGPGVVNDGINLRILRQPRKAVRQAAPLPQPIFNITGKATTPHVYSGNTWQLPTQDIPSSQSTEVTSSQLGTPGNDSLYFLNALEQGRDGSEPVQWDLMYSIGLGVLVLVTDSVYLGTYGGNPLYLIRTLNFKNCGS